MTDFDRSTVDAQSALVGLLARPLITGRTDAQLHRQVRHHLRTLNQWVGRCGYQITQIGDTTRLHRTPLNGSVEAPGVSQPPSRRELVLALVAAAAVEDGEATVTVQSISDKVRNLTGSADAGIDPYNPDRRAERVALLRALERLEQFGVLRRRTFDEQLVRRWEEHQTGIGAGYEVHRDAILQLVDPAVVYETLTAPHPDMPETEPETVTAQRLLRRLVETTAVLYGDLTTQERAVADNRRAWLCREAQRLTGGVVEIRAEGLTLVLHDEHPRSADITVGWPNATTRSWVALLLADSAIGVADPPDDAGIRRVDSTTVNRLALTLHEERAANLTREMRDNPARIRESAEDILVDCGLLRLDLAGHWLLLPTAARYRTPVISVSTHTSGDVDS